MQFIPVPASAAATSDITLDHHLALHSNVYTSSNTLLLTNVLGTAYNTGNHIW
jgi:hypothetical protein